MVARCNKYKNNNIIIIIIVVVLELQKVPKPTTKIYNIRTKTSTTPDPSKGGGGGGGGGGRACCQNKPTKKGKKEGKKTIDGSRRQKFVRPGCTTRPYIIGSFDTNYIIFRNVEIFLSKKKKNSQRTKKILGRKLKNLLKIFYF
jgi:hypothetical protein